MSKRWRLTRSSALAWPRIGALASSPATRPRAPWPCGWRMIATSVATSARCCPHGSAKPRPPLAKKTTQRTSLPAPQARRIWHSVSTSMTPRLTPVSRPGHSTPNAPCSSTCCVQPGNDARLRAACAPSKTCAQHSRGFSTGSQHSTAPPFPTRASPCARLSMTLSSRLHKPKPDSLGFRGKNSSH